MLPVSFWRRFAAIENVVAIKIAPFNRYRTLDVVRGVVAAGAADRVTLYTGNDDHIVLDLITPFTVGRRWATHTVRIKGGLLGHWSVWVKRAVELLDAHPRGGRGWQRPGRPARARSQVTDCNAAIFDVANDFHGVIAGCHEILRRQGSARRAYGASIRTKRSAPARPRRSTASAPAIRILNDDDFVRENLSRWLS